MSLSALAALCAMGPTAPFDPETIEEAAYAAAVRAAPPTLSDDAIKIERDTKADIELGAKYAEQVDRELRASTDAAKIERIDKIGRTMADIANRVHAEATWGDRRFFRFPYRFKVVQGKDVNAFSIPGGYIYVYEGLIDFCESDDELAGVIGHEIAHASFRHVATLQREANRVQQFQLPLLIVAILTGGVGAGVTALGAGNLVGTGIVNGWSVKAERSADWGGFQYITQSRWNPTGMLTMMERLAAVESRQPSISWGIFRTHPPGRERAMALTEFMETAGMPIRRSQTTTTWRTVAKPTADGRVELRFGSRQIAILAGPDADARATAAVERLNLFFDTVPEIFMVTPGGDGTILGRRRPILELTPEDAKAAGKELRTYRDETIKRIGVGLYGLAFHIWESQ